MRAFKEKGYSTSQKGPCFVQSRPFLLFFFGLTWKISARRVVLAKGLTLILYGFLDHNGISSLLSSSLLPAHSFLAAAKPTAQGTLGVVLLVVG